MRSRTIGMSGLQSSRSQDAAWLTASDARLDRAGQERQMPARAARHPLSLRIHWPLSHSEALAIEDCAARMDALEIEALGVRLVEADGSLLAAACPGEKWGPRKVDKGLKDVALRRGSRRPRS